MRRIIAVLAVSLLALFGIAAPAQASINGCADGGYVCFYNWYNFNPGGGFYQVSMHGPYGTCHNLPLSGVSGWPGGKVYDTATSLIVNNSGTNSVPGRSGINFFEWANCNTGGQFFTIVFNSCCGGTAPTFVLEPDLTSNNFSDTIGSWDVIGV